MAENTRGGGYRKCFCTNCQGCLRAQRTVYTHQNVRVYASEYINVSEEPVKKVQCLDVDRMVVEPKGMLLFKITNCSRERQFCVVAEMVGKLLEKAKQKFVVDDLSSIVMDDDGTIVDDHDVLSALKQNTVLMALADNDR